MHCGVVLVRLGGFVLAFVLPGLVAISVLLDSELIHAQRRLCNDREHPKVLMILLMEVTLLLACTLPEDIHFDCGLSFGFLVLRIGFGAHKLMVGAFDASLVNLFFSEEIGGDGFDGLNRIIFATGVTGEVMKFVGGMVLRLVMRRGKYEGFGVLV